MSYYYSLTLNTVQLMVFKVLTIHKNIELLSSDDCYDLSPGNNYTTNHITLVLVAIPVSNQLGWMELEKEDRS